jgi:hypothetical protein
LSFIFESIGVDTGLQPNFLISLSKSSVFFR